MSGTSRATDRHSEHLGTSLSVRAHEVLPMRATGTFKLAAAKIFFTEGAHAAVKPENRNLGHTVLYSEWDCLQTLFRLVEVERLERFHSLY